MKQLKHDGIIEVSKYKENKAFVITLLRNHKKQNPYSWSTSKVVIKITEIDLTYFLPWRSQHRGDTVLLQIQMKVINILAELYFFYLI